MGSYYSSGYCLISATGAADSNEGLFMERHMTKYETKSCLIGFDEEKKTHRYLLVLDLSAGQIMRKAPLMKWGWCMQERLLSCRVLHWTKDCLIWECPGTPGWSELLEPSLHKPTRLDGSNHEVFEQPTTTDTAMLKKVKDDRLRLVTRYSNMNLTYQTDRPAAIHGVACRLLSIHGGGYFAGLFRNNIISGLAWMVEWTDFYEPTASKALGFTTWSWASSDAQFGISFPSLDESLIQCLNPEAFVSAPVLISFKDESERILHLRGPLISLDATLYESSGQQYQRLKKCRSENGMLKLKPSMTRMTCSPVFQVDCAYLFWAGIKTS
ncbi:HET domain-containing protein [Fusarium keratoplasticum]|uniref:HET domain-containing protein n=1 Tax=Fusarium keratoplasticum TaxID=1328300 RepID=A0ACC0R4P5_9HYPO|nr:HET domain-containing protein [Fusarium keratoplasticum]KAI8674659.1 HET domain-containing protein [Fusarium keratoplasticum]